VRQLSSTASSPRHENGGVLADTLYRAIVDTAVDGIVAIDRNGAIRSANKAIERLFTAPGSSGSAVFRVSLPIASGVDAADAS
jgi:PAS domain-containing protein